MWCESQFQAFGENLKLDPTRSARIASAIGRFDTFCRNDAELSEALDGTPFLQGSVATNTSVRPVGRDEHDVDLVFPLKLSVFEESPEPSEIIRWFLGRLRTSEFYKSRLIPKDRCARIDYAGDFHLDIIPATRELRSHQPLGVPAKSLGAWITTDPLGFEHWVKKLDERSGDVDADGAHRFVRAVRMMKRWRDRNCGKSIAPSSILLTTILGKHEPTLTYRPHAEPRLFPEHPYMAAFMYDMLRLTDSCIGDQDPGSFQHPTLAEDLARDWREHLAAFRVQLQACIEYIGLAIQTDSEDKALEYYRSAFGEFPAE